MILARIEVATAEIRAIADGEVGDLVVGVHDAGPAELLGAIIEGFAIRHPNVALRQRSVDYDELWDSLASGRIDVLFTTAAELRDATLETLFLDPMLVGVRARHRLASRPAVSVSELLDEDFIPHGDIPFAMVAPFYFVADRDPAHPVRFGAQEPPSTSAELLHQIAAGVGIVGQEASMARFRSHPGVRSIPVTDASPLPVSVATRTDEQRPLPLAFRAEAHATTAELLDTVPGARLPRPAD